MVIFLYNLYIFGWMQHCCLANEVSAVDPSNSVIKSCGVGVLVLHDRNFSINFYAAQSKQCIKHYYTVKCRD